MSTASANRQIARAAGTVMAAFVLSNLAGLLRQVLVAGAFGTSAEMEAFNAANRVSETLFNLIAGGALGSAFIPTFSGLLAKTQTAAAWRLASALANLLLLGLGTLAVLAAVFAPQIVQYALASGFAGDAAKTTLTVELMRLMLPSAVIFGLSGLVMGILNAHQVFFIPALTPSFYQFGLIFGAAVLARDWGIYGLAYGVLLGASLHLLLQLPALWRLRGAYTPTLGLRLPEVQRVMLLMGPRLLGQAVVHLNFWVNTNLASYYPGSVTAITLGFALMLMPQAAIAQAAATAAMPTLAAQYVRGEWTALRSSLGASLRGVLLLSLPAALGLMLLRTPVVALLYERGEFDARSTELVAWALLWYAAGLVGHSLYEILARAFYALQDTRTPVLVGVGAMSLNIVLSIALSQAFAALGWMPHGGLALANSLATGLEALTLAVLLRRRVGGLEGGAWRAALGRSALASLGLAAAVLGWLALSSGRAYWLQALPAAALGGATYGLGLLALRAPEALALWGWARRRLGRGAAET